MIDTEEKQMNEPAEPFRCQKPQLFLVVFTGNPFCLSQRFVGFFLVSENEPTSFVFMFVQPGKQKKKFSSFFKSLVIELDKDLYGPDNHLVEVSTRTRTCTLQPIHRGRG